ncbi:hypothetical protein BDZ89DRAFT_1060177 [Hymenopellis radicata]|nr:hypothetical protein BDZ89DRAFT_1060177 [Hymenopellis radicata]
MDGDARRKRQPSPTPHPTVKVKARVNSSATPNSLTRKPSRLTTTVTSSTTPRANSPAGIRPSPRFNTPTTQPKSRPFPTRSNNARSPPSVASSSTPGTPVSMYHGLSKTPSLDSPSPVNTSPHRRTSSVSILHDVPGLSKPKANHGSPASDAFTDAEIRDAMHGDVAPKIKSRITKLVKHGDSLSPSPPSYPPSRPANARTRAPSMSSSNLSLSSANTSSTTPEYNFYPITTGSPAANPHRYGSGRAHVSPPANHSYQPFPRDDAHVNYNMKAKVDPATIPLPPISPPTSALSFSSRSSASRSSHPDSGDSAPSLNGAPNPSNLRSALDTLVQFSTAEDDFSDDSSQGRGTDVDDVTRKVRADAKTNRKIEDLEITNRSLLAINATLEATKHRQAKEIRDLKRKLRESRLILPPRAYRADDTEDEDDDDENEADQEGDEESMTKGDECYHRVKALLDGLVKTGKRALETQPKDFVEQGKTGAKVLSAEEVRDWEAPDEDPDASMRIDDEPPPRTANGDDDGFDSEDEVAAMALPDSPSPPPILVTESP